MSHVLANKAYAVIGEVENELSAIIKSHMTGKRLVMMALKDEEVLIHVLSIKHTSDIMWTRGDGTRYKEMNFIKVYSRLHSKYRRKYSTYKRLFPSAQDVYDFIWEYLKNLPNAKEIGEVRKELSGGYDPALRVRGMLWIRRPWGIEYGHPSRLKNTSVWNLRDTVN